jgi:SAM-dependent methyltransferase
MAPTTPNQPASLEEVLRYRHPGVVRRDAKEHQATPEEAAELFRLTGAAGPEQSGEVRADAMSDQKSLNVYDSEGDQYSRAFGVFLAHTDQKAKAAAWLAQEIEGLANRDVFLDAGAGDGQLTGWLAPRFQKTIAIEPNPSFREALQKSCPGVELLPVPIDQTRPNSQAGFVLCSHVFYHIDRADWAETLRHLVSWLRPGGVLAVALANYENDCMRMLRHFKGEEFDLGALARAFAIEVRGQFDVRTEVVEAHVQTDSFEAAYIIAEFLLNALPLPHLPPRAELERYIRIHFQSNGHYRFSCHQDFLRIHRRA